MMVREKLHRDIDNHEPWNGPALFHTDIDHHQLHTDTVHIPALSTQEAASRLFPVLRSLSHLGNKVTRVMRVEARRLFHRM